MPTAPTSSDKTQLQRWPATLACILSLVALVAGYGFFPMCAAPVSLQWFIPAMIAWSLGLAVCVVALLLSRPRSLAVRLQVGIPSCLLLVVMVSKTYALIQDAEFSDRGRNGATAVRIQPCGERPR